MRIRLTSSGILLLVVVAASSLTPSARGVAASCEGQEATITGATAPGGQITGTPGDDVIVTEGDSGVRSLGGDDLICVTGDISYASVSSGDGNDRVVNLTRAQMAVILGPGDDSLVGGPAAEQVGISGLTDELPTGSAGHDTISTGGGADVVATAAPGEPNTDVIDLGDGEDTVRLEPRSGDHPSLDGGAGADWLVVDSDQAAEWRIDNVQRRLTRDGTELAAWDGFENFGMSYLRGPRTFVGGAAAEKLTFENAGQAAVRASMGGGDDTVSLGFWHTATAPGTELDGGAGRDRLNVQTRHPLTLDLRSDALEIGPTTLGVPQFEDAGLTARRVDARGDGSSNRLLGNGCKVVVRGGPGADVLTSGPGVAVDLRLCPDRRSRDPHRILGEGGHDRLIGAHHRDVLIGGAGRDYANGRGGRDVCRAERERLCER